MRCSEFGDLIHGYLDGELDLSKSLEIERHIGACTDCSRTYTDGLTLRRALTHDSLYFEAPKDLRKRIRSAVRKASRAEATPRHVRWEWRPLLASLGAVAVGFLLALFTLHTRPPAQDLIIQEVLSAHVRSLMPGHLLDVSSSDQHTVKPWFNGKLDFSPPVADLAAQGFPLAGGRLDYIGNRPVAALVYQRRKHLINLFVWPSDQPASATERSFSAQGYNMSQWIRSGMAYFAVSDVNAGELYQFAELQMR